VRGITLAQDVVKEDPDAYQKDGIDVLGCLEGYF
jgi:hypothetical protein